MQVQKRNGQFEDLDISKITKVINWAAEGLENVSVSQVELNAKILFADGMKTSDIHKTIIKAAADLISPETPDYQYLAARLAIFHIRKIAFGQYEAPDLYSQIERMVKLGKYDKHLLEDYTKEEIDQLNEIIDHTKDLNYAYAAVKQLEGKYLVQNRVTGEIFESPQFILMLVPMCLFAKKKDRMTKIKAFYESVSNFKISLPTPIMSGVRTPTRQFSSCVLIESGDSLNSINASAGSIVRYVSQRAGIGINGGRIRAIGSEIRGGEASHTGVIPFWKHFQTAVKCCSQGGVRGGAATLFYPMWHYEYQSLVVLKNNRGVEENRIRHMDYGVQINGLLYKRLIDGKNISLFSPSDVPGLYEAFFSDQAEFERLYTEAEANPKIRRNTISAIEAFSGLMQERASTGRIYVQNVDNCNIQGPFDEKVAPVRQSNLCLEIALPTKPLENVDDPNGEVALCTLSAFNLGAIESPDEFGPLAEIVIEALDALLDYQNYPLPAAERSTMYRRTLGVGVIGYAHWIAKNGFKYSDGSANEATHELFEAMQYHLMRASVKLAKEYGACPGFHETKMAKGILPVDTYRKNVDKLVDNNLKCDWEGLRQDILKYGMRNSTVSALMPSETSSQISNETNGIEPPRGFVSIKASKDGQIKQVVPELKTLRDKYELLWTIKDNTGYLTLVAIMQKFVDQAISANTNYDPMNYPGDKVPMKKLLQDLLTAYRYGVKTLYYHNTRDHAEDKDQNVVIEKVDDSCGSGACKI